MRNWQRARELLEHWITKSRIGEFKPAHAIPDVFPSARGSLVFASSSGGEEPRTVTTQRRRRSEPSSGGRERAAAPTSDRPSSSGGGTRPPSGGGSGSGGGMGSPRPPSFGGGGGQMPRNPTMLIGLIIVAALCIVPFLLFNGFGGGGNSIQQLPAVEQAVEQQLRPTESSFALPSGGSESPAPSVSLATTGDPNQTWLIMLYQDADDKILEKDIFIDFNEAERVGSNDQVQIVSQLDRYRGGFDGDGDWNGTRRYYVTQDDDLTRIQSQLVEDMGEVNMASGDTLVDFVTWAASTYPADNYVLILSDHGMGWPGGWSDPATGGDRGATDVRAPIVDALGNQMYLCRDRRSPGPRPGRSWDRQVRVDRHGRLPDGPFGGIECAGRARALRCRCPRKPSRRWAGPMPASCVRCRTTRASTGGN